MVRSRYARGSFLKAARALVYTGRVTGNGRSRARSVPPRRIERDSMGSLEVPEGAYYGASTRRAAENFPISGERFDRRFILALGTIKYAAAIAHRDLGFIQPNKAHALAHAAGQGARAPGALDDPVGLDIFQTRSGTFNQTKAHRNNC